METPPKKPVDVEDDALDPPCSATPLEPAAGETPPDGFEEGAEPREAESRGLTDMLRKAMVAGLGAVFMTEEGIRTYVKDLKLPKDVVRNVVGQAGRSKDELFRVIGEELRHFFESDLLRREVVRLLSQVTIEVNAQIRLRPDGGGPPEIKVTTTARPSKPDAPKKKRKKG